jgi:hypothetical protein
MIDVKNRRYIDVPEKSEAEIDEILAALKRVWMKYPAMKLVQVVKFVALYDRNKSNRDPKWDYTYTQDADWVQKSKEYPY